MSICNLNPAEQAKYNKNVNFFGEQEAFRDYVAQNGLVRSTTAIQKELEKSMLDTVFFEDFNLERDLPSFDSEFGNDNQIRSKIQSIIRQNNRNNSLATVESFSKRLGIPYTIITSDKALEMTGDPLAKAFYSKGEVYLIEGRFTGDSLFHEFAHPIIKALAQDNPELFEKLYSEIPQDFVDTITTEYSKIKAYEKNEFEMKQEVMVQSLTQLNADAQPSTWIGKIAYQIKQFLRKFFGKKINLKDLSSKTTLKGFVDMINFGKEFTLDMNFLSEDEFIFFERDFQSYKDMLSADSKVRKKSQELINDFSKIVRQQIDYLQNVQGYKGIAEGLVSDVNNANLLQTMNKVLQLMTAETTIDVTGRVEYSLEDLSAIQIAKRLNLLAEQLLRIENVVDILDKKADFLAKSNMQEYESLDALTAIQQILTQYVSFLDSITSAGSISIFTTAQNPLKLKLDTILEKIIGQNGVLIKVNDMRANIVVDTVYDYIVSSSEEGRLFYENQLKVLKDANSTLEYNRIYKEYYGLYPEEEIELQKLMDSNRGTLLKNEVARKNELLKMRFASQNITREEFKEYIVSDVRGVGVGAWFNRMFEGFMMNQDKTVGGFYSYVTDQINTIKSNVNSRQGALLAGDQLNSLMKAAGWGLASNFNSPAMGKAMGEKVDVGRYNSETGEVESFLEWQFKTGFKNHAFEIKKLKQALSIAREDYKQNKSIAFRNKLADLQEQLFFHNMYFMNQDNTDEVYIVESILYNSPTARLARWAMEDIYEELNFVGDTDMAIFDIDIAQERNDLFNKLSQLANAYYLDGTLKTGEDADIAKTITNYLELRKFNNMFEWELQEDKFRIAYDVAMEQIKAGIVNYDESNSAHAALMNEKRNRWIELNTTTTVISAYYDIRNELLEQRSEILQKITDANSLIYDTSSLYEELYDLNKQIKDSSGQYDGILADPKKMQRIKEIHEELEQASLELYSVRNGGLTNQEVKLLNFLQELEFQKPLTPIQNKKLNDLKAIRKTKFSELGIFDEDIEKLIAIDLELKHHSFSHFTTHYVSEWQRLFNDNEDVQFLILSTLNDLYFNEGSSLFGPSHKITNEDIQILLLGENENLLNELREIPEFNDWFSANHFERDRVQMDKTGKYQEYRINTPLSTWYKTSPINKDFYETFDIFDAQGNLIDVLRDKNDIPRVPNANYNIRTLNSAFINNNISNRDVVIRNADGTESLQLATKNNREVWLPKSLEQRKTLAYKILASQGNIAPTEKELENFLQTDSKFNQGGAGWDRYTNYDYLNMFKENRPMFNLTQYVRDWTLDNQSELNAADRLDVTYPKIRTKGIENISKSGYIYDRNGKGFKNGRAIQRFADNFRLREDDAELEFRTVNASDNSLDKLDRPISGHYSGLDINEISTDILQTTQQNLYSIQEHLVYRKLYSTAKSFEFAINSWGKPGDEYSIDQKGKLINLSSTNKEHLERAKSINSIIEQHFRGIDMIQSDEGKKVSKTGKEVVRKVVMGVVSQGMQWSSRKWFMFNPMSGLTNYVSGNLQAVYKFVYFEEFVTPVDFIVGHRKAIKTLSEYTRKTYSAKEKSAIMQLMDIMDASPDSYLKRVPDPGSRNITKDLTSLKFGYASRVAMTNEMNYSALFALMNNKKYKFKIGQANFTLDQVVELNSDGKIVTRVGTPQEYSISYDSQGKIILGEKLNKLMKHHKGYLTKIHGMGGKYNDGDYDRYILGKVIGFLFKWLPGMLMDRGGVKFRFDKTTGVRTEHRFNWNTQAYELGMNVQALKLAQSLVEGTFVTGFKKRAFSKEQYKGLLSLLSVYFMDWLINFVRHGMSFGSDSERRRLHLGQVNGVFAELKPYSSLPDYDFINPDRRMNKFNTIDWWKLQASRLMHRVQRENSSFMPQSLFSMGFSQFTDPAAVNGFWTDLSALSSYFWQSATTLTVEEQQLRDLENTGLSFYDANDKTEVGQTSGPYITGKKGEDKLNKLLLNFVGFNGNLLDPYTAQKNELSFYKAPWNPLDIVLGDPKYQPKKPYVLGKD